MKVKETVAVVEALMAAQGEGVDRRLVEGHREVMAMIDSGELDPEAFAAADEVLEERWARVAEDEAEVKAMQLILDTAALSDLPGDVPILRKLWDVEARARKDPALRAKLRAMGCPVDYLEQPPH